ncbi:MAG: hypothetical protein EAZ77_04040 [Nostocales cyanobacterium]|nr:MAG: hypothetical protein EAZ77_04040 [Nostocales cyanobacterium]
MVVTPTSYALVWSHIMILAEIWSISTGSCWLVYFLSIALVKNCLHFNSDVNYQHGWKIKSASA